MNGFARSGKDEAAKVLVQEFNFTQVAFADKLREVLYQLNPIVDVVDAVINVKTLHGTKRLMQNDNDASTVALPVYVQDVIDKFGWDGYKETRYSDEIRRLLQRLGTEAGRQTLWDTIWIDAALHDIEGDIVISDARFINEFDAITNRGGMVWRVERDGVGPQSNHPSETEALAYNGFERIIYNNGSLEDYHKKIIRIGKEIGL